MSDAVDSARKAGGAIARKANQRETELPQQKPKSGLLQSQLTDINRVLKNFEERDTKLMTTLHKLTTSNEDVDDVDGAGTGTNTSSTVCIPSSSSPSPLDNKELLKTVVQQWEQMRELRKLLVQQQRLTITLAQRISELEQTPTRGSNLAIQEPQQLSHPVPCFEDATSEERSFVLLGNKEFNVSDLYD